MTKPFAIVLASLAAVLLLLLGPTTTHGWIIGNPVVVVRHGSPPTTTHSPNHHNGPAIHHCGTSRSTTHLPMMVELEPEPEGGIVLQPFSSMTGCRLKQLDETVQTTNAENKEPAYKFWMTGQAEGALIKEIRTQILKDASKKANFPGFRKGQVPPYAQPQITLFAVQESIIKTVEAAVDAYGLLSLKGSDGEVKVHEDVSALAKGYKTGDSIPFTATLNASYNPEKPQSTTSGDFEAATIDVTATTEEVGAEK